MIERLPFSKRLRVIHTAVEMIWAHIELLGLESFPERFDEIDHHVPSIQRLVEGGSAEIEPHPDRCGKKG
jgi:hypothetical protein